METIRISEKKIKIMLCQTDMWRYDLSVPIDITSEGGKHRLRRLLRDACCGASGDGADADFDPDSGELLVQIYESRSGCELFVTRCGEGRGDAAVTESARTQPKKARIYARRENVYKFGDMDALLALCSRVAKRGRTRAVSTVYEERGAYFLTYDGDIDALCAEYGGEDLGSSPLLFAYLTEHASRICGGDAVGVLSALY